MTRTFAVLVILNAFTCYLAAQEQHPEVTELYIDVPVIDPGDGGLAPSDAIVLFDGSGLEEWSKAKFNTSATIDGLANNLEGYDASAGHFPAEWLVSDGAMIVAPGKGDIMTKRSFSDIQLHIEWLAPLDESKSGQAYSNSGIYLMGLYEVQVLNSHNNDTYSNGQAGSIYKQHPPLVNASKPPGEWQEYDIVFMAPRFNADGRVSIPARITVFHNGVLVQNNVPINGPTLYVGITHYLKHSERMPIRLQDHGDRVRYRNIWVREL